MKTNHINHVILYAKNFYRHSGDVVKDMQRFMQLDGHKFWEIKTPEKLVKVMKNDYLEWVNSITDEERYDTIERLRNEAGESVAWADGSEGQIWSYLIKYDCYIPMTSKVIGYPKYDQYHMPQFNIKECIFRQGASYEVWNKEAQEYLDKPQVESFDEYMNFLMDKYPFEELTEVFNKIGDNVSKQELEDEMWEEYEKFIDEHLKENEELEQGCFDVYSKHFMLTFKTRNYEVDIDVQAIYNHKQYVINDVLSHETVAKFIDIVGNDSELIDKKIIVSNCNNEVFSDNSYHNICQEHNNHENIEYTIKSLLKDFNGGGTWGDQIYNDLIDSKYSNIMFGGFSFNLKEENGVSIMDVYIINVFACSIKEKHLDNYKSFLISDARY